MSVKLVVFDMAGTTVEDNNNVHQALIDAMDEAGISVSLEEVNDVMGYPKPVAITQLLKNHSVDNEHPNENLIKEIHEDFVSRMILFYRSDLSVAPKIGAEETFLALRKKRIKIALDTGFDRAIADAILNRLFWKNGFLDATVTSDEVERGRPYPDLINRAMQITEINNPDQVMKVGDTISDLQEGRAAGCKYIVGLTSGAFSRVQLAEEYHTHLIDDLREILDIID